MTPRVSSIAGRTRRWAEKQGWPPPLAWDDIDTDAEPHGFDNTRKTHNDVDFVTVQRILAGAWGLKATRAEKEEVCRRWAMQGVSVNEIERRTGWRVSRYYLMGDAA